MRTTVVALGLVVLVGRPATAQFAVIDVAAVARLAEHVEKAQQIVEHTKLATDVLSGLKLRLGGLGGFRITPILPTNWDTQGAMPAARILQIADAAELVAAMPAGEQRQFWEQQLAQLYVSARTQSHALKQSLATQTDAAGPLSSVINALVGSILSGRDADHAVGAILDKIAIGSSIHAHQLDGLQQITTGTTNVIGVINQRQNNTEVEQLNLGLTTSAQAVQAGQSYMRGSSDAIRHWRFH